MEGHLGGQGVELRYVVAAAGGITGVPGLCADSCFKANVRPDT